jgi:hypothetical protein
VIRSCTLARPVTEPSPLFTLNDEVTTLDVSWSRMTTVPLPIGEPVTIPCWMIVEPC